MRYIESNLLEHEKLIYAVRPHWIVFSSGGWAILFAFIIWIFAPDGLAVPLFSAFDLRQIAGLVFFMVGAFWSIKAYIYFTTSEYAVTNKRVVIALQYIHGIGATQARKIVEAVNIPAERRTNQLTDAEVSQIREVIDRDHLVEGDLRREVGINIKRLMDLGCYRGLRHRRGLPVRGQRTHTNARTRKGPAKSIAGKKK